MCIKCKYRYKKNDYFFFYCVEKLTYTVSQIQLQVSSIMLTLKQLCYKACINYDFKRYNLDFLPRTIQNDITYLDKCCFEDYNDVINMRGKHLVNTYLEDLLQSNHIDCFRKLLRKNPAAMYALVDTIVDKRKVDFFNAFQYEDLRSAFSELEVAEMSIKFNNIENIKYILNNCLNIRVGSYYTSQMLVQAMKSDKRAIFELVCDHMITNGYDVRHYNIYDITNRKVFYIKYLANKGFIDLSVIMRNDFCSYKKKQRIIQCDTDKPEKEKKIKSTNKPKKEKTIKSDILLAFLENRLEDFKVQLQSKPVLSDELVKKILRKADTSYLKAALENSVLSAEDAMAKLVGKNPKKIKLIESFM